MIKRILVTLSANKFTDSALSHGIDLARRHQAKLIGVTDVNEEAVSKVGPVPLGGAAAAAELAKTRELEVRGRIDQIVHDFDNECTKASVDYEIHREEGEPFDRMHELWRYSDLIIVGLRGLFSYDVISSPEDILLRMIGAGVQPVLAVSEEPRAIRKALIAYNGSPESAKAMKRFVQMNMWPSMEMKIAAFGMPAEEAAPLLEDASEYCRAHGHDVSSEHIPTNPRQGILKEIASGGFDIAVMGSTARSRIARKLMGDTVLEVIKKSEVPLFLAQ